MTKGSQYRQSIVFVGMLITAFTVCWKMFALEKLRNEPVRENITCEIPYARKHGQGLYYPIHEILIRGILKVG